MKKFEKIDERFIGIDKKFDTIEENVSDLAVFTAKGFQDMDYRFDEANKDTREVKNRLDRHETYLDNIQTILIQNHRRRISALEKAYLES